MILNEWFVLALVFLMLVPVCLVMILYHKAHGAEAMAVEIGAHLIMESLQAQGYIQADPEPKPGEAFNIGEEEYDTFDPASPLAEDYKSPIPDSIMSRADRAEGQMDGDAGFNKTMEKIDDSEK